MRCADELREGATPDDDEVLRAVSEHLIGNMDVATLCVTNFRVH